MIFLFEVPPICIAYGQHRTLHGCVGEMKQVTDRTQTKIYNNDSQDISQILWHSWKMLSGDLIILCYYL